MDDQRRTDTNSGEEKTRFENGEDKRFASFEAEWLCPLTKIVPRLGSSTFFGAPKLSQKKDKEVKKETL